MTKLAILSVLGAVLGAGFNAGAEPPELAAPEVSPPPGVAVLPLGLTAETHARYPQLADASVGLGIHNRVVEELFAAGRVRLVEDKPEVIKDLVDRQWVATTGAISAESAVGYGKLLGARYVIYGEVFEFGVRKLSRRENEVRLALQVRLVDVETSEYLPASGRGLVRVRGPVLKGEERKEFTRSAVGEVTGPAVTEAVRKLLESATKRGWLVP